MAKYNHWQNGELLAVLRQLSDEQLHRDIGLFFHSVMATINHILWVDQLWLSRIAGRPEILAHKPQNGVNIYQMSTEICQNLAEYSQMRIKMDETIMVWANQVDNAYLHGNFNYTTTEGQAKTNPVAMAVCQLFNHQTHHRGQVHGALHQFGVKPYTTDIPYMPQA